MRTLELEVVDWSRSHRASLAEVPADTPVGTLVTEVRDAMVLPRDTAYHLLYDGVKLNGVQTLEEVGVEDGVEMVIAPEVQAG